MARFQKPFNKEQIEKMHAELKRLQAIASIPPIKDLPSKGSQGTANGIPLFHTHPPVVRDKAFECLALLTKKHKDKLASKGRQKYFGILCGVAVHMAKRQLGLIISSKAAGKIGWHRRQRISALKTHLGLQPRARTKNYIRVADRPKPEPEMGYAP